MAYAAVMGNKGKFQSPSAHSSGGAGNSAPSGDVYLAWNTTNITTLTDLKHVLQNMLDTISGGMLKG